MSDVGKVIFSAIVFAFIAYYVPPALPVVVLVILLILMRAT